MSALLKGIIYAAFAGTKPLKNIKAMVMGCSLTLFTTTYALGAPQPSITPTSASETSQPSLFDAITNRAKILAKGDFKPVNAHIPDALLKMDYDQYRSIRFRPDSSVWHNEAQFV